MNRLVDKTDKIKINYISNIVLEPLFDLYLETIFCEANKKIDINCIRYEEFINVSYNLDSSDYIIIHLNFERLHMDAINRILSGQSTSDKIMDDIIKIVQFLYDKVKRDNSAVILWFGFEDYSYKIPYIYGNVPVMNNLIERINTYVCEMLCFDDIYIDTKRLIANIGIKYALDETGKHRWNSPYSEKLIECFAKEVCKQYFIHIGKTKKCIVLDCDNVLWGGIISEDGIEKIKLGQGWGQQYQEFQRFLLTLYYNGVILTICSKNDENDVLYVFRNHSGMILKEEHIASFKVNWDNKSKNIINISQELNIGLDSIVFVDDSVFEIEEVKLKLPEVTTILYNKDSIYDGLSCFNLKNKIDIASIQFRHNTYKSEKDRNLLFKKSCSYKEFIDSLELKIDIHESKPAELARISELTQRTNKCTNGVRYTVNQLKEIKKEIDYSLFSVFVSDRFSDLGLVGTIGICGSELDLFSLSCRALGRDIEEKMIEFVKQNKVIKCKYIRTSGNTDLLEKLEILTCNV